MIDFYFIETTGDAIDRYEMSGKLKFVNRMEIGDALDTESWDDPILRDDEGNPIALMPEPLALGTELPASRWEFDDAEFLPDFWGSRGLYLVSERFREAAGSSLPGSEFLKVEVSGKARVDAQQKNYAMLRIGILEHDALDVTRTTTEIYQGFRFVKDHHFRDDFVPRGPIFMIPESVYTFVTADLADRIQCAGITDVQFKDPSVMIPDVGYPLKPMPKNCP